MRGLGTSGAGTVQWTGSGGFSANGGKMTVAIGGLANPTPLRWNTTNFLPDQYALMFGSTTADSEVEFRNPLDLAGGSQWIAVEDNPASAFDFATVSGVISNGSFNKGGNGLLRLTAANTYTGYTILGAGVLRAVDGVGLPTASNLKFAGTSPGSVLEGEGSTLMLRGLGTGPGQVQWTGSGGFSACGGKMTVALGGTGSPTPLTWGSGGFVPSGSALVFGSTTADNETEFKNSIDFAGTARTITVNDNPTTTADFATISGTLSNGSLIKDGAGTLVLANSTNATGDTTVKAGALTVNAGTVATLNVPAGGTANLNSPARATAANVSGGQLNLNGTVTTLTLTGSGKVVTTGPIATAGTADFSAGTGTVNASTNPLIVTNMANFSGSKVTLTGGSSFKLSGSDVINPSTGNHRVITAAGGTLTITPPATSTVAIGAGSGTASYDSGTGVWSLTQSGTGGFDDDNSFFVYAQLPAGDLDFKLRAVSNPGSWAKVAVEARDGLVQSGSGVHYAQMYYGNIDNDWATRFQGNTTGGAGKNFDDQANKSTTPYWMELQKVGLTLSAYRSADGVTWTQVGSSHTYTAWGPYNYVGIAIDNSLGTNAGTFDNVPFPVGGMLDWSTTDVAVTATSVLSLPSGTTKLGCLSLTNASTQLALSGSGATGVSFDNISATDTSSIAAGVPISLRSGNVTVSGGKTLTVSTNIVSGTLNKLDTGTLTLSGANTHSGGTTLSAGTLTINNASALGTGTFTISGGTINNNSAAAVTLSTNNAQTWDGNFTFTGTQHLNLGTGAVSLGTAAGTTRTITASANTLTVGGVISDGTTATALTKAGGGTLMLSNANTYTGLTTVSPGTLTLAGSSGTIADTAPVTVTGGTLSVAYSDTVGAVTISGGTINGPGTLTGSSYNLTTGGVVNAPLAGVGVALTKSGANVSELNGTNTYTGGTTISSGTLRITSDAALGAVPGIPTVNVTLNGGILMNNNSAPTLDANRAISLGASGGSIQASWSRNITINGKTTGTGALTILSSSGWVILTNANDYSGTTKINSGGKLQLGNGGTTGSLSTSSSIVNNGTLAFKRSDTVTQGTAFGVISSGSGAVTQAGTGTLVFSLANAYTGATTISAGVLRANSGTGLPTASNVVLAGGVLESSEVGTFTRALGSGSNQVQWTGSGGFSAYGGKMTVAIGGAGSPTALVWGSGNFVPSGSALVFGSATADNETEFQNSIDLAGAARTITANDNPFSTADFATLSGTLSNGSLTKDGAGTLVLKGSHTYTGATTISGGTLKLASGATVASTTFDVRPGATFDVQALSGGFTLAPGRTLKGSGTVLGDLVAGGVVAPGSSPGILTVEDITFSSTGALQIELGGTARGTGYDALAASGTVTLQSGSSLAVTLINSYVPAMDDQFDILDFAGLSGEFSTVSLPALGSGLKWDASDLYTTGTTTVVPEPATLGLLAAGLGTIWLKRRRKA